MQKIDDEQSPDRRLAGRIPGFFAVILANWNWRRPLSPAFNSQML